MTPTQRQARRAALEGTPGEPKIVHVVNGSFTIPDIEDPPRPRLWRSPALWTSIAIAAMFLVAHLSHYPVS